MKVIPLLLLFGLVLQGCGDVREITLANGLKVVVKEDHRSPVVVSQIWYKVGGVDEPEGLTGISHVLEHMMFKGTQRLKPGEFSRIIAEHGGRENAFTGRDYTAYFQQLEKSRLPISFELEADRMQNLTLPEAEFRKEVQVVLEERRLRTDDKPEGKVYEAFMRTAFQAHPYGNPIIGSVRDLEALTPAHVRDWYKRWYVPNNATLVVVGDVKPREVFDLAEKYFGAIPRRAVAASRIPAEPPQQAARRLEVQVPAQLPYLTMGFHVPALNRESNDEPYALDVLAGVLDGGDSARFARHLVRERQIALSLDTDYSAVSRYPGLFSFEGVPAAGHTVAMLEQAISAEIARLQNELVSDAELQRVKAQVMAREIYGRDSVFNQAMVIGMLETVGLDWRYMDKYTKRIQSVSAAEVREVAKKYLRAENLTVTTLKPLPLDKAPAKRPARVGGAETDHVR